MAKKDSDKVQVYILAGQSNMVGMGAIDHLDLLVQQQQLTHQQQQNSSSTISNEYRTALWCDEEEKYRTSDDVYVKYSLFNASGKLTVARDSGFAAQGNFGPELMFGFTIGGGGGECHATRWTNADDPDDAYDRRGGGGPVLLIKTAWGGKSLAVDFRPPSSGKGTYNKVKPIDYGTFYRQMITEVLDTLNNIGTYVPGGVVEYDLAGFVWFQGWNDMLKYPMVNEYGGNLVNFIHDVRSDLDAPHLPFGTIRQNLSSHWFVSTLFAAHFFHSTPSFSFLLYYILQSSVSSVCTASTILERGRIAYTRPGRRSGM
jgi:Carbohydrate esterase, sialic acid-specific acetylesterase